MSLDNRLREGLGQLAAEFPRQPIDIASDLQGVLVAGRRRRVFRQTSLSIAAIAIVALGLVALSNVLNRSLGLRRLDVTDRPPQQLELPPIDDTNGGGAPALSVGAGGGRGQAGPAAGSSRRGLAAAGGSVPTPKPAGAYSYVGSGGGCNDPTGGPLGERYSQCGAVDSREDTFDQPNGSHQHSTATWYGGGGRQIDESTYDYRPDGVYFECFMGTWRSQYGMVTAKSCPALRAAPVRVWPAGAKPGDHFEYTIPCGSNPQSGTFRGTQIDRVSNDILRVETL